MTTLAHRTLPRAARVRTVAAGMLVPLPFLVAVMAVYRAVVVQPAPEGSLASFGRAALAGSLVAIAILGSLALVVGVSRWMVARWTRQRWTGTPVETRRA